MIRISASMLVISWSACSVAAAAESSQAAPKPPPGWEMPPPIEVKSKSGKKVEAPACCGYDELCCTRQADIDRGIRAPIRRTFALPFANIQDATIKEATAGGAPIEGVPDPRVVDGAGTPFPWAEGPKLFEIRLIPDGKVGYIRFGDKFSSGHYRDPQYRSIGYGVTAPITDTPDKGRSLVEGPFEYWMYDRGQGDEITVDHVRGKLEGSPKIIVERWVHGAAVNAAEGIVHVYRATYQDKPYVFFLLPEVVVGFESKDAHAFGGTGNDRFASDFPYTEYRFPLGPNHSDTANCILREYEVRRWFDRPKDAMKLPDEMPIIISMSQTSAEKEPQIRIMFL